MGFGVIKAEGRNITLLEIDVLKLAKIKDGYQRLQLIHQKVSELVVQFTPDAFAIEAPFFGKNVQSMLKLGRAQGVAIAAAMSSGVPVTEYSPKKVKQSITGNGNAAKDQVFKMLQNLVPLAQKPKHYDATDALAVAICHHFQAFKPIADNLAPAAPRTKKGGWETFLKTHADRVAN